MRYTLDTNAVTALIRTDMGVLERLERALLDGHEVTLNAFAYYEVRRGLVLPGFATKYEAFKRLIETYDVLELDLPTLEEAAIIYQTLRVRGEPIEDADILIAATAIRHDATLVTRNTRHLARVPGLLLENWEA
jgi:tRNA(fMet)-specific endonuclease VapC